MTIGVVQFGREYDLRLGAVNIASGTLPIAFEVERDSTRFPNRASIDVYNLNPTNRKLLEATLPNPLGVANVSLRAGYEGGMGEIFRGQLRTVTNRKDGMNWVTTCTSGDSDEELNAAKINKTFSKGTPIATVFAALAAALKLNVGNLSAVATAAKTSRGPVLSRAITLNGNAADQLQGLCDACDVEWSCQSGTLQLTSALVPSLTGPPHILTPETGLLGAQIVRVQNTDPVTKLITTSQQVALIAKLLPNLIPGRLVVVNSLDVKGTFVVTKTLHRGESHGTGEAWTVEAAGVEV